MAKTEEQDRSATTDAVKEQLDDAKEGVEGRATKGKQDEEFREQQQRAAREQNQRSENAVPEQRPQATQETLPSHQGSIRRELEEAGELPDEEPMSREAFERAASDEQRKKAAKEEKSARLFEGAYVQVLKEPYVSHRAVGAIIRVEFDDPQEAAASRSGVQDLNLYAVPSRYIVKLRGGRPEQLSLEPDEVREISVTEYNAGGV